MKRYIRQLQQVCARRRAAYHTQCKVAEQPTTSSMIEQWRTTQEEKEKDEKK